MPSPLRVPVESLREGSCELAEATARYVHRVHRLGPGARLELFEPTRGTSAIATIERVDQGRVTVSIGEVMTPGTPGTPVAIGATGATGATGGTSAETRREAREIVLVQSLAKGEKMDAVIRDATELGATRIVPVEAERSVVRLGKLHERAGERALRWRRVAVEASRQCGRNESPRIDDPASLVTVLETLEAELRIVLVPTAEIPFREVLGALSSLRSVALLVGPEGGISPSEIDLAQSHGWVPATLGPRTLRTETVAAAVLGALMVWG